MTKNSRNPESCVYNMVKDRLWIDDGQQMTCDTCHRGSRSCRGGFGNIVPSRIAVPRNKNEHESEEEKSVHTYI